MSFCFVYSDFYRGLIFVNPFVKATFAFEINMYTLNMATIQSRKSRGQKYWYIVESKRVNGKPRPITLAYLGKADDLLKRLEGLQEPINVKSYAHGHVAALLEVARKLNVVEIINKHCAKNRTIPPPLRHDLTAGITYLFAAIGRACQPTSKQGWYNWAKDTSLAYLLNVSIRKIDSQHFWDMMDILPSEYIPGIEADLLEKVKHHYQINSHSLVYDTTNFYTFIHTTNTRNTIAQRGKNKQHRHDLRQIGMAMVVTHEDHIPLFHLTYQGNWHDTTVFDHILEQVHTRLKKLGFPPDQHTFIFDRGNNSKYNFERLRSMGYCYVGALTPAYHKNLVKEASDQFQSIEVEGQSMLTYRKKYQVWGQEETVVVFISEQLKAGQLRGIYRSIEQKKKQLHELQEKLNKPKAKKRNKENLEKQIRKIVKGQYLEGVFQWSLRLRDEAEEDASDHKLPEQGHFMVDYTIDEKRLQTIEDMLGYRILVTNRHNWQTAEIIKAYFRQASIEHTFRDMKAPSHLAVRPQYHWTDQKIRVHFFICVLGYLLSALIHKELKEKAGYEKSISTMLANLSKIRLASLIEPGDKPGQPKVNDKLEEMDEENKQLMQTLGLLNYHKEKPQINGVVVYK